MKLAASDRPVTRSCPAGLTGDVAGGVPDLGQATRLHESIAFAHRVSERRALGGALDEAQSPAQPGPDGADDAGLLRPLQARVDLLAQPVGGTLLLVARPVHRRARLPVDPARRPARRVNTTGDDLRERMSGLADGPDRDAADVLRRAQSAPAGGHHRSADPSGRTAHEAAEP